MIPVPVPDLPGIGALDRRVPEGHSAVYCSWHVRIRAWCVSRVRCSTLSPQLRVAIARNIVASTLPFTSEDLSDFCQSESYPPRIAVPYIASRLFFRRLCRLDLTGGHPPGISGSVCPTRLPSLHRERSVPKHVGWVYYQRTSSRVHAGRQRPQMGPPQVALSCSA